MDKVLSQMARVMNSAVHAQGLILDMLNRFFEAEGSIVVEFDSEFKIFASWRSKGIDHVSDLEATIARHWFYCATAAAAQPAMLSTSRKGTALDSWSLGDNHTCLTAYLSGSEHNRPTAWCVVLKSEPGFDPAAALPMLSKLLDPIQTIHSVSKGFTEVASQGVLSSVVAETSPWGMVVIDSSCQMRFMNARARSILARNNGLTLANGRVRISRSASDRALQMLLDKALSRGADDIPPNDLRIVSVPASDGKVGYAIEVRPFHAMKQVMSEPGALLIITDFDSAVSASCSTLAKVFSLSEREAEFAEVFGQGYRLQETAQMMQISPNTARIHLQRVLRKTGTQNQVELARVLSRLPHHSAHGE